LTDDFAELADLFIPGRPERPSNSPFGELQGLSAPEKFDLALSFLAEIGVTGIKQSGDELIFSCPLPNAHAHGDRNPSAAINAKKLLFNCLAAETLVKTYEGEFPIKDLVGSSPLVLDGDGKWTKASIRSYGMQSLMKVTLSRNGVKRVIYVTPGHRWLVRPPGHVKVKDFREVITRDLKPKMRIPSVWPMTRTGRVFLSPLGVMRGFVYGDGSVTTHGAQVNFCGAKDTALEPYFSRFEILDYGDIRKIATGVPRSWKLELPSLGDGPSFLYGWLAGYFAADGCVSDDGIVTLACARKQVLEFVVTLCDRLGIATYGIGEQERFGYGTERSSIYQLSFRSSCLDPKFFLIPRHRERFEEALRIRKYDRTHWWVSSVEETDRFEEVFCAEVPTTHSFVLAGNVLTGNCLGCHGKGTILWLHAVCKDGTIGEARQWVEKHADLADDPDRLLRQIDEMFRGTTRQQLMIPRYPLTSLTPWRFVHPYLLVRGVTVDTIKTFNVGWNPDRNRIVVPLMWKDDLVGWITRRVDDSDGSPKYMNSPDAPRESIIYHYQSSGDAVVVESPLSVLVRYPDCPRIEATLGSEVTDAQLRLLSRHNSVVLAFDPDDAGYKATRRVGDFLLDHCPVRVIQNPWNVDVGDLSPNDFGKVLSNSVPYALWHPPSMPQPYKKG